MTRARKLQLSLALVLLGCVAALGLVWWQLGALGGGGR